MPPRPSRPAAVVLALLATLVLAAPVAAQTGPSEERVAAEETLAEVQRLADGRGIRSGRELSVALLELATRRNDLSRTDRAEADELLARPTTPGFTGTGGPYSDAARVLRNCSAHFCVHWVDSTADAPPLADADSCPTTPDFVDHVRASFEQSYAVEIGQLGWQAPVSDGGRGGDGRTDVYLKQLNDSGRGLYGYASTDPGQSGRTRSAFMVLDNDYRASEFPAYEDDPRGYEVPVEVTAAHEYNHVLQYAYDVLQDPWMYESTATWAEEKVFAADDDYHLYMGTWADHPGQPLTSPDGLRKYGSAIWNHWLEQRYGADVVRRAWERSIESGGFAPDAYDLAIADEATGTSFAENFGDFAAATAAWEGADSGIHEGSLFDQEVKRELFSLAPGTVGHTTTIDHTGYKLFDIPVLGIGTDPLRLTGSLRQGAADGAVGTFALVGIDDGGDVTKVVARTSSPTGDAVVTMPGDPSRFDRLTAVVANADVRFSDFDEEANDWVWSRDGQTATLSLTAVPGETGDEPADETPAPDVTGAAPDPACGTTVVEREPGAGVTPTPTPSPTASPTPSPTVSPTPTPTPAASLRLSRSTTRIGSVVRTGRLALFARSNKSGRLAAASSVDRKTARRLRVGRRTTSTGTGRRTLSAPGRFKVNVRLKRKVRSALKRHRNRTLRIKVVVRFVPADGTRAVRRTLSVLLRP